ncbi:MAG: FKBP-type peptidyl-prolyl cis-trans isomerase [Muribaculaceae bacterium]|nr:FKBP-type peptidyl-prolyl cis-trans isomerase [Muribaculaceae bacterium]
MIKKTLMLAGFALLASMTMYSCKAKTEAQEADEEVTEVAEVVDPSQPVDTATYGVATTEDFKQFIKQHLADNDKEFTTTSSGLMYRELKKGSGEKPASPNATVTVHYTGKKLDGSVFDSSVERGEPATFPLNRVIKGWTEGVQLMNVGSKYEFIIPSDLAYGQQGTPGGPIGPNEDLYFEIELLGVQQ